MDLYAEAYDSHYPVVCCDEKLYQWASDVRQPLPAASGRPVRYDDAYRREGTCNLFLFFQPLHGWRHIKVTERRTARDFAHGMKDLVDVHFPRAARIRVVLDNLNTHTPAALYETLAPAEARRILQKLDFRDTPKHGSWLNLAEVEWAVVSTQCLDQRLGDPATLGQMLATWEARRNAAQATVSWRFTTGKARRKLKRLYPA